MSELKCKPVKEDISLLELIKLFKRERAVVILDQEQRPITCITAWDMIDFLHQSYQQLLAFYETVIKTTNSSITVVDAKERVRTWTQGAEAIFSVKKQEILGKPITHFFDRNKLEILNALRNGKSTQGKTHQPKYGKQISLSQPPIHLRQF